MKKEGAEILQFQEQVFKIIDKQKLTDFAEENSNSSNIRSLPPPIDEESNLPEATTNSSLSPKKSSQINRSRPVSEKISDQESSSSEEDPQKKTGEQNNEDEPEVMKDDLDSLISSLGSFSGMPERRTRPQRAQPVKPEAVKLGMDINYFLLDSSIRVLTNMREYLIITAFQHELINLFQSKISRDSQELV